MKKFYLFVLYCFLNASNYCLAGEIKIEADAAKYNEITGEFSISGDLKVSYEQQYVTADSATYNKILDKLVAKGNVKYSDKEGNIYMTEQLELSNKFNVGKATQIKVLLKNESIIFADRIKKNNEVEILEDASYTSCEATCKNIQPLWKIDATEVIINRQKNEVYYKNALLKVKNIPLFYTPFFTSYIKKKRTSGLLSPTFIRNSILGSALKIPVYFNIAANRDLIVAPIISQHKNTVYEMEYRHLSTYGYLESNFSYKKKDQSEKIDSLKNKNYRSHIFLKATANLKNWYNKIAINLVSDKNYLKNYDFLKNKHFTNETNMLTSKVDLQRKYNSHKFTFKTLYFQNLSLKKNLEDTTLVLPAITFKTTQPYQNGSKTEQELDFAIIHKHHDINIKRTSAEVSYVYPLITSWGIQTNTNFLLHSDIYSYEVNKKYRNDHFKNNARVFPEVKFETTYPLISTFKRNNFIITPIANVSFKPKVNYNKNVAFEDSQFNEINFNNVFVSNKYSGYDIVESGTRYNYGLRFDLKPTPSKNINFLVGQSYYQKVETNDKIGKNDYSNLVGKLGFVDNNSLFINYIYTLDHKRYELLKHSLLLNKIYDKYSFDVAYTGIHDNIPDANNIVNKKELFLNSKAKIYKNLDVNFYLRYDLTNKKYNKVINHASINKLTKLGGGVTIYHNCAKVNISAEQDYTQISSKPNNTYWIRIWLKNLV